MRAVVRAHDARLRRLPTVAVLRDVVMAAWRLGAIGLVAVGASGLIAWVMNAAFGRAFVGGAPGATRYSAADCQHWLSLWTARAQLRAGRCAGEQQRRGVPAAGRRASSAWPRWPAYHLARRRSRDLLPDSFTPTVAMTLFGAAGLVLAGLSVDSTVLGLRSGLGTAAGAGFYASGAIVALVMALRYARDLHRSILRQARG